MRIATICVSITAAGQTPPINPAELAAKVLNRASPDHVAFDGVKDGSNVCQILRQVNERGQSGPWSEVFGATTMRSRFAVQDCFCPKERAQARSQANLSCRQRPRPGRVFWQFPRQMRQPKTVNPARCVLARRGGQPLRSNNTGNWPFKRCGRTSPLVKSSPTHVATDQRSPV